MARQWLFLPKAESDLDQAASWYAARRPGLGLRFIGAVDEAVRIIRVAPMQFPEVAPNVRRALLRRFPYAVYFRVSAETGTILAIAHLRRDPQAWRT